MKKLRLLVTKTCNRACPGCCNKEWDLDALPVCESYEGYDEVILTGGEPMLNTGRLMSIIMDVKMENPDALIYMYSAKMDDPDALIGIMRYIDGVCLTIHEYKDGCHFVDLDWRLRTNSAFKMRDKSLRLNIFKEAGFELKYMNDWKIKYDMEWITNCPLPKDEVFMKWNGTI